MKLSEGFSKPSYSMLVVLFYAASFAGFGYVLKRMEVGVAYAVWAGLGTALVAAVGVMAFGEDLTVLIGVTVPLMLLANPGMGSSASLRRQTGEGRGPQAVQEAGHPVGAPACVVPSSEASSCGLPAPHHGDFTDSDYPKPSTGSRESSPMQGVLRTTSPNRLSPKCTKENSKNAPARGSDSSPIHQRVFSSVLNGV